MFKLCLGHSREGLENEASVALCDPPAGHFRRAIPAEVQLEHVVGVVGVDHSDGLPGRPARPGGLDAPVAVALAVPTHAYQQCTTWVSLHIEVVSNVGRRCSFTVSLARMWQQIEPEGHRPVAVLQPPVAALGESRHTALPHTRHLGHSRLPSNIVELQLIVHCPCVFVSSAVCVVKQGDDVVVDLSCVMLGGELTVGVALDLEGAALAAQSPQNPPSRPVDFDDLVEISKRDDYVPVWGFTDAVDMCDVPPIVVVDSLLSVLPGSWQMVPHTPLQDAVTFWCDFLYNMSHHRRLSRRPFRRRTHPRRVKDLQVIKQEKPVAILQHHVIVQIHSVAMLREYLSRRLVILAPQHNAREAASAQHLASACSRRSKVCRVALVEVYGIPPGLHDEAAIERDRVVEYLMCPDVPLVQLRRVAVNHHRPLGEVLR
mmetsp:Transcript_11790/g.34312  ORF Transcript_11790/g.34312 Transcript_11790/m.34312 type:complete len:430 (+) Transcript_11790:529-1818(+)